MSILTRLRDYNPPDRATDDQRQIAVDIQDAIAEIERLMEYEQVIGFLRDVLQPIAEFSKNETACNMARQLLEAMEPQPDSALAHSK